MMKFILPEIVQEIVRVKEKKLSRPSGQSHLNTEFTVVGWQFL